jgi:hypothetical protein
MKQRVLITLGDSWTEGVGCYGIEETNLFVDENKRISLSRRQEFVDRYLDNFHKEGWPNRVGKKLGFDKVINLGWGASSNSSDVKSFYNFVRHNDFSDSEVLVIWMMTDPVRFSFYIDSELKDYMYYSGFSSELSKEYINELKDFDKDPILEQIYYIESLKTLCDLNGLDLVLTSWSKTFHLLTRLYQSKNYLFGTGFFLKPPYDKSDDGKTYKYHSFCLHPNELGYEWVADKIVDGIKENHSKWYNDTPNENLKWEWKSYRKFDLGNNII